VIYFCPFCIWSLSFVSSQASQTHNSRKRSKCTGLCYTLGRLEFERFTSHCMEFKITKDKIAQWNKMFSGRFVGVCNSLKLWQTPQTPPKNNEIGLMDNRNQERWVYSRYFMQNSNILFKINDPTSLWL